MVPGLDEKLLRRAEKSTSEYSRPEPSNGETVITDNEQISNDGLLDGGAWAAREGCRGDRQGYCGGSVKRRLEAWQS